jgi:hypothetical protein
MVSRDTPAFQLGGVDVAKLMNCGRDLGFLAVFGPELLGGGIPQWAADVVLLRAK